MRLVNGIVWPLRLLLALGFLGCLVLQLFSMPGQFRHLAQESPRVSFLQWPLTFAAVLVLLGAQVVIVCTWRLLSLVGQDRIFSRSALSWVDSIAWAMAAGWVVAAAAAATVTLTIYFTPELRDPGIPVALFGLVLVGAVAVLLVLVLRALLQQATTLRADLDGVI